MQPLGEGRTSTELVRGVLVAARSRGISEHDIERAAGVRLAALKHPGISLPVSTARKVFQAAVSLSSDDALGLHVAENARVGTFGPLEYLLRSSQTWGDAVRRLARFLPVLHSGFSLSVELRRRTVHLLFALPGGIHPVAEMLFGFVAIRTTDWIGEIARPVLFASGHARPRVVAEHERIVQAPLAFGRERHEIVFCRDVFDAPMVFADGGVAAVLDAHFSARCQPASSMSRRPASVAGATRHDDETLLRETRVALRTALESGDASVGAVAQSLGTTTRSLQRHLAAAGTCHRTLLDELRGRLAEEYCSGSRSDQARAAGYAAGRSLRRAQSRWSARA